MANQDESGDKPLEEPDGLPPGEDLREQFARLTAENPVDAAARRAFIKARLEMIRRDARMSSLEKEAAAAMLKKNLEEA